AVLAAQMDVRQRHTILRCASDADRAARGFYFENAAFQLAFCDLQRDHPGTVLPLDSPPREPLTSARLSRGPTARCPVEAEKSPTATPSPAILARRRRMARFESALMVHPDGPLRHTLVERIEGSGAAVQVTLDGVSALEFVRLAPPQVAF